MRLAMIRPGAFLAELSEAVELQAERLDRRFYLIAESDRNNVRLIRPREQGGLGIDASGATIFSGRCTRW